MQGDSAHPKIILVTTNLDLKYRIQKQFLSSFYKFQIIADGEILLENLKTDPADIVLIDAQHPENYSSSLIKRMKETDKNIRIIVLTNQPSEQLEQKVRSLDIAYFAVLPDDQNYIHEIIRAALIGRQRERLTNWGFSSPHKQRIFV